MLRRELAIAFRAPVTWVAAAVAALVVGHGFVLAVDLFEAASRSVTANALMQRELDPLAGIVRPVLGGCQLATAVLVPVLAARLLSVEKERGTFGALCLVAGSPGRVAAVKLAAAAAVGSLVLVAPAAHLVLFVLVGGHLDALETLVAFSGHVLHVLLAAGVATAAAAWTRTVAQATVLAIVMSLASWAVEAGEGFAALAWLGPLEAASVSRQLAAFEAGIVHVGALVWFAAASCAAVTAAWLGCRFDLPAPARGLGVTAILALTVLGIGVSTRLHRSHDWTELARASLPPAAVVALRGVDAPLEIVVWMDREDSRRRQLERDVLAKLRLARSDVRITMPLDGVVAAGALAHDDAYGRVVLRVGDVERTTRSASRREIVTTLLEAAGKPLPDWSQPVYPGYPLVLGDRARWLVRAVAYVALPGAFLLAAWLVGRRRRSR